MTFGRRRQLAAALAAGGTAAVVAAGGLMLPLVSAGANVTVTNEPYNGSIAPGSSVTFGFTATGAAPATLAVTC